MSVPETLIKAPSRVLPAGALMAVAAGLAACTTEGSTATQPPQPVRAAVVQLATDADMRSYTGTIKPRFESDLAFRVGGKITERLVNIGDAVTPGMALARLDATDYGLSLELAEAELGAAESSLRQADADERRYADLNQKRWVSDAGYDQKKAAADEARGRMERAKRALALARNQLAYTELQATEAGVVTALPVEVGQVVAAGQLIARVARLAELEAVVSIPEGRINRDRGGAASVRLWADQEKDYAAKLRELSPQADPATRTYQARYSILNPDSDIALGKTATVLLKSSGSGEKASLPLAAVFKDQGQPSVWVINENSGRLVKTEVQVEAWTETSAVVSNGLEAGQKIVAAGIHKLDASQRVRVVEVVQ